jgi:hypothetical protein
MKIVYKKDKVTGEARDLRSVHDDKVEPDDIVWGEGDDLPDIETLHDAAFKTKRKEEEDYEQLTRELGGLLVFELVELLVSKGLLKLEDFKEKLKFASWKQLKQKLGK